MQDVGLRLLHGGWLVEQTRTEEVLAELHRYLDGEISRDELQDFLVPLVVDPDAAGLEAAAKDLVYSIQLHLAEFTSGHLTEEELRAHLRDLLPRTETKTVFISYGSDRITRDAASPQDTSVATLTVVEPHSVTINLRPSAVGT
jgi:hypothetical protein